MTDFSELLRQQYDLQVDSFGVDPLRLTGEARAEFIRWNVLALEDELHEMLDEVGWKPWATSRHVNEELATKELVDAFHFLMNLIMAVAPRGSDVPRVAASFTDGYTSKRKVNAQRQEDGYDGLQDKCPSCHREKAAAKCSDVAPCVCPCGYVWPEVKAGGRLV